MDAKHPKNNIDPRPKRRRDKDNPYEIFTIGIETDAPRYYIRFKDISRIEHCLEIPQDLFDLLDSFELDDLSFLNEWDRHLEQSEQTEATLNSRAIHRRETVEEEAFRHIENEMLHTQTQYTYLASASRSANVDRYIKNFIERKKNGIIVQIGCGLETTYYRNDNGQTQWYGVDLPHVIEYRKGLLPENECEKYISGDAFSKEWIEEIRSKHPIEPLLIVASGLFYYFEEENVLGLIKMLMYYGDIEILFDAVNKSGMTMMQKKHMKTVGHEEAKMFFYVDSATELATKVDSKVKVLAEENFYRHISRKRLKLSTKISMVFSDLLGMVKMIHLSL